MDGVKNFFGWFREDNFLKIRFEVLILFGIKKFLEYSVIYKEFKEIEVLFF